MEKPAGPRVLELTEIHVGSVISGLSGPRRTGCGCGSDEKKHLDAHRIREHWSFENLSYRGPLQPEQPFAKSFSGHPDATFPKY